MTDLESTLRQRFAVREQKFMHGQHVFNLLLPQSAEDLLDEEAFARDERMPYWADLWPSARALARWLLHDIGDDRATAPLASWPTAGRWIELGCGIGLPSLIVKACGGDILATDFNDDALLFARCNAVRNDCRDLKTQALDWRDRDLRIGKFDHVIAADVLYEQRNATALVDLLPRILAPGGRFVIADPGRRWLGEFSQRMKQAGWREQELAVISEPAVGEGNPSSIRLLQFAPAAQG